MTREEAILHMTLRREELKHSVGDLDEDIKAFDMAIKALEQKPWEEKLAKAKSEILQGANRVYNFDFSSGCCYTVGVIEKYMEELNND